MADWNSADPNATHCWADVIESSLRVLEGKWKIVIISVLLVDPQTPLRFSELERRVAGVSQKMLIQQLKELERDGIIHRKVYPQVPPKVEYTLTEVGVALAPAMKALIDWAEVRYNLQRILPQGDGTTAQLQSA